MSELSDEHPEEFMTVIAESPLSVAICEDMYKKPFWKREKIWREDCEKSVVSQIVEPINQKIKEDE